MLKRRIRGRADLQLHPGRSGRHRACPLWAARHCPLPPPPGKIKGWPNTGSTTKVPFGRVSPCPAMTAQRPTADGPPKLPPPGPSCRVHHSRVTAGKFQLVTREIPACHDGRPPACLSGGARAAIDTRDAPIPSRTGGALVGEHAGRHLPLVVIRSRCRRGSSSVRRRCDQQIRAHRKRTKALPLGRCAGTQRHRSTPSLWPVRTKT